MSKKNSFLSQNGFFELQPHNSVTAYCALSIILTKTQESAYDLLLKDLYGETITKYAKKRRKINV